MKITTVGIDRAKNVIQFYDLRSVKVDRPDARIREVVNQVYELFLDLDAADFATTVPDLALYDADVETIGIQNVKDRGDSIGRTLEEQGATVEIK